METLTPPRLPDQFLATIADLVEQGRLLKLMTAASLLLNLVLGSGLVYTVLFDAVYIQPPGGPGLVKPGVLDDGTARDYAERALETRWTFTPETFKAMQEEVLASSHPSYTPTLKAELEKDARLVHQFSISSQLTALTTHVLQRKEKSQLIAVHARRTLTYGTEQDPPEYVDVKVVVTLMGKHGSRRRDIVVAQSSGLPTFRVAKQR